MKKKFPENHQKNLYHNNHIRYRFGLWNCNQGDASLEAKVTSTIATGEYDGKDVFPRSLPIIHRSCYSLGYDCRTRNASWVYERITATSIKGDVDRKNFNFKEDPTIPEIFRSRLTDYKGSGFDRGHLAPAGDHKIDADAMADTFYLSNMSP